LTAYGKEWATLAGARSDNVLQRWMAAKHLNDFAQV
jgi:hypothetical protein